MRSDEEGVASTIGTTMALLVFLTFLSLIVNQYVPAWMRESEASHANTVIGQFGSLKGAIDLQILAANSAQNAGRTHIPVWSSTAVVLGVDGVPIFASATPATMAVLPSAGPFVVTFDYDIRGVRTRVVETSNGSIEIDLQNRYYEPQRIVYENGAVIRFQNDGQVIRGSPTFVVRNTNNVLDISFGLVSLYGGGTITGIATEVINAQLFALDDQIYEDFPSDARIWINHTSRYAFAWYRYMNDTLSDALALGGTYNQDAFSWSFVGMDGGTTVYSIATSYNPATLLYNTRLEIINNPGIFDLGVLRLQHALVQSQVGEATDTA